MKDPNGSTTEAETKTTTRPPIHLKAKLRNGEVKIESDQHGPVDLPRESGRHRFTFILHDHTMPSMGVRFCTVEEGVLDIAESDDCPPKAGINTDQIENVESDDRMATFVDKNSGRKRRLSYALNFRCDDPAQRPQYDPTIINGGDQ